MARTAKIARNSHFWKGTIFLGATIVEFRMPDLDYLNVSHLVSFMSEVAASCIEHLFNGMDISLDNYVIVNQVVFGIK